MMRARSHKFWNRKWTLPAIGLAMISGLTYIVLAGSVSKERTPRDLAAIAVLGADRACADLSGFDRQLGCARFVQRSVQTRVADMRCAENGEPIEPMDFLERGYGCCFDRARFMAKAHEHYGLRTRHVSLHDRSEHGVLAYLVPGVRSHASTEVLTDRGWMGVDSNQPFVLLTRDGTPVTYSQLPAVSLERLEDRPAPRDLYQLPLLVTYGLYSRHGRFHGPDLPAPEINYPEFIRYNFAGDEPADQNG